MEIPMKTFEPTIDFFSFIDLLEKKYNFNYRDMAGQSVWMKNQIAEFAAKHGRLYDKVYNTPPHQLNDEEKKILNELNEILKNKPEYLDAWHYLIEHDFIDGPFKYLSLENIEKRPEWIRPFFEMIKTEVQGNPAVESGMVRFYVEW